MTVPLLCLCHKPFLCAVLPCCKVRMVRYAALVCHAEDLLRCAAFDKSDLMYLRDEEERQRFTEDERRDRELQQFQKQRACLEPGAPGPAAPRPVRRDKDKGGTRCFSAPKHVHSGVVPWVMAS